jgi:hypothetical protein
MINHSAKRPDNSGKLPSPNSQPPEVGFEEVASRKKHKNDSIGPIHDRHAGAAARIPPLLQPYRTPALSIKT